MDADQRLEDAAALHLVIVLADDPFLAAHVRRGEDLQQDVVVSPVGDVAEASASGSPASLTLRVCARTRLRAPPAAGHRAGSACPGRRPAVPGRTAAAGPSPRNGRAPSPPRPRRRTSFCKLRPLLRRHRQDHALLRLARSRFRCTTDPAYFSGALSSCTLAPSPSAISPTAELKPPAPQSVMA